MIEPVRGCDSNLEAVVYIVVSLLFCCLALLVTFVVFD